MTSKAEELSTTSDWCGTCERGWSWVDGNVHRKALARSEELEAALRYLVSECDEDMDDEYNPHSAPLAQARAALEQGESGKD